MIVGFARYGVQKTSKKATLGLDLFLRADAAFVPESAPARNSGGALSMHNWDMGGRDFLPLALGTTDARQLARLGLSEGVVLGYFLLPTIDGCIARLEINRTTCPRSLNGYRNRPQTLKARRLLFDQYSYWFMATKD